MEKIELLFNSYSIILRNQSTKGVYVRLFFLVIQTFVKFYILYSSFSGPFFL